MASIEVVDQTTIIYREQEADFKAEFVESNERVNPIDPLLFPNFAIISPFNEIVATGVGQEIASGLWNAHWSVPKDSQPGSWKIRWALKSDRERQYEYEQTFTIREKNDDISLRDDPAIFIFFPQVADRVTLLEDREVTDIDLSIRNLTNDNREVLHVSKSQMKSERIGARTLWYCDLPPFGIGSFMLLWSFFTSSFGPRDKVIKRLEIPPMLFWDLYPKLADYVDRIQKDSKNPFGYFEEDLMQYMHMGIMEFNRYHPATSFTLQNFPRGMGFESYLIECSALWAFKARQLGAGELGLSYSGQETTLEADRQQVYADQISAIQTNLDTHLVREKTNFIRHTYTPARLGMRLGLGASAVLGGGDLLGGITSPYLRGFSRARRRGSW